MLMSRALILRTKRSHWRVVTIEQQKDRERERQGKGPTRVVTVSSWQRSWESGADEKGLDSGGVCSRGHSGHRKEGMAVWGWPCSQGERMSQVPCGKETDDKQSGDRVVREGSTGHCGSTKEWL